MAVIRPFRGVRYNPDKIDSYDSVLAPPYDVIKPDAQKDLYEKSPYNVVRLILNKETGEERYTNAADTFAGWMEEGILIKDEPAIYPYYQSFTEGGKSYVRKGFLAAIKLEDYSAKKILPHEHTFAKPKADRLKLTTATRANLSPILSIYSDLSGEVEKEIEQFTSSSDPILRSQDGDGVVNRMWKITDVGLIDKVALSMNDKNLLIADGHHRYETALNYRDIINKQTGVDTLEGEHNYVLMFLSRAQSDGLIINPTHRVVKTLGSKSIADILKEAEDKFDVTTLPFEDGLDSLGRGDIAIVTKDGDKVYKLTPKLLEKESWKNIAVLNLHRHIIGAVIDEEDAGIVFTKFKDEAVDMVRNGDYALSFVLPSISPNDVIDISLEGEIMPHKSTYFYPKILSGLVFHLLY